MITVALVDDHAAIRSGLAMMLGRQDDIEIVAEADNGASAVTVTRTHEPDVVLMDIRMPGTDGIEATRQIVATTRSRVLVLTTFDLDEYVFAALRAGASGFLLKTATSDELTGAVRSVAEGDAVLAPQAARALIGEFVQLPPKRDAPPGFDDLTEREREVLALLGAGLSNAELSHRLGVGGPTVKTHVSRVLSKLHLSSRVQAAILARELGL
ncbi:response regulator transcription factor [Rhodococcus triatomae]|uniref:DNA-binding response regulator, NarL/FixJ family, contains REC and HTH domains n=1 Tax=Rhodococcus triatomae TaxID=300028 RepID=A0A1G8GWW5_9NOCA|nr:response regulator transcription factor [Rhodococcus triatomae]QNG20275.1 response regulator transcription factor [Rhodococcus triatomae]QNG23810.1 response regulator transcription factor [Rhodococcus triatomae]SDH98882.1 DNA-binding response regulator, NarL/FixJ family, contains REC and HTH domains [Rhodococcus triatomae]